MSNQQEHPTPQCPNCGSCKTRPLDESVVVCFDCDNEWRQPTDDMDVFVRYGYSKLSDTWYRVYDWVEKGDGKIQSKAKEEVPRSEVPDGILEKTGEVTNNE